MKHILHSLQISNNFNQKHAKSINPKKATPPKTKPTSKWASTFLHNADYIKTTHSAWYFKASIIHIIEYKIDTDNKAKWTDYAII